MKETLQIARRHAQPTETPSVQGENTWLGV